MKDDPKIKFRKYIATLTWYDIYCDSCDRYLCRLSHPRELICYDCWRTGNPPSVKTAPQPEQLNQEAEKQARLKAKMLGHDLR